MRVLLIPLALPAHAIEEFEDNEPGAEAGLSAEGTLEAGLSLPTITLKTAEGAPVLDGYVESAFWSSSPALELPWEMFPVRLAPAEVTTRVWVRISSSHVYVAFEADDDDMSQLRSGVRSRDGIKNDDYVSIVVDPSGRGLRKYEFRVNPSGSVSDVLQDTPSDRYIYDWDAQWQAAARISPHGYSVEMAIPRPETRMASDAEPGAEARLPLVILKRHHPRRVDRTLGNVFQLVLLEPPDKLPPSGALSEVAPAGGGSVPAATDDGDAGQASSASAAGDGEGEGARNPQDKVPRLTLVPHFVFDKNEERSLGGSFEQVDDQRRYAVGFSMKYAVSEQSWLGMTVNPNYSETESDIARDSINNQFDPFQPEQRTMFVDVGEYFQTLNKAVYTRNIVQPDIAISYLGSGQEYTSGVLLALDQQTQITMPDNLGSDTVSVDDESTALAFNSEHYFGKRSLGLLGTFRSGEDYHNALLSVAGTGNLGVDDKVRGQLMVSDTEYPQRFAEDLCNSSGCTTTPPVADCELGYCTVNPFVKRAEFDSSLQGYNLQLRYKHDGPESLYWARYYDVSPDFRADLGFIKRVDFRAINFAYGRKWYFQTAEKDESQSRLRGYLVAGHMRSHEEDDALETSYTGWLEFRGSYQTTLRVGRWLRDRAVNRLDQADLSVADNAPMFREQYWQWYSQTSPFASWTLYFDGRWGRTADPENLVLGDLREMIPKLEWFSGRLSLMTSLTWRTFHVDDARLYKEEFFTLRAMYYQSPKITHRMLWTRDLTKRDIDRWRGDELDKETDGIFEYTVIYQPDPKWKLLSGVRFEQEYQSDVDERGLTAREIYFKAERMLQF